MKRKRPYRRTRSTTESTNESDSAMGTESNVTDSDTSYENSRRYRATRKVRIIFFFHLSKHNL